jgi:peptide deformylase
MAVLPVIKIGHPTLRKKADKVSRFDSRLDEFASDMIETMQVYNGIGLAGNQVNILDRIFVIDFSLIDENLSPRVYINPHIISMEGSGLREEGCLSIPDVNADVERATRLEVEYQTLGGESIREELEDLAARVFQHELDHLNGVLFIDHLSSLQRKMLEPQIKKIMEANSLA